MNTPDCQQCNDLMKKLKLAEQTINLLAPSCPADIVKLRCQILEIRTMLDRFTSGRYHVLADGMAASRLIGAHATIENGQPLRTDEKLAVLGLLEAVGVVDIR